MEGLAHRTRGIQRGQGRFRKVRRKDQAQFLSTTAKMRRKPGAHRAEEVQEICVARTIDSGGPKDCERDMTMRADFQFAGEFAATVLGDGFRGIVLLGRVD
jgi:hypothetical protein